MPILEPEHRDRRRLHDLGGLPHDHWLHPMPSQHDLLGLFHFYFHQLRRAV